MTWQTPFTATDGTALTAAQLNQIRDNLMETAPAKATGDPLPATFYATGFNSIAQRLITSDSWFTLASTGLNYYHDIGGSFGPGVNVTHGSGLLVHFSAFLENDTAGTSTRAGIAITAGVSDIHPDDSLGLHHTDGGNGRRTGVTNLYTGLAAGTDFVRMQYRVSGGTGSFKDRHLVVQEL